VTLGVLPLGTANDFARAVGIPEDLEAALDVLAAGQLVEVDLGVLDDRCFVNVRARRRSSPSSTRALVGGGRLIAPRAVLDDGLFDVCLVDGMPILELASAPDQGRDRRARRRRPRELLRAPRRSRSHRRRPSRSKPTAR
jgi:diacylglycerol kinase family enzyme